MKAYLRGERLIEPSDAAPLPQTNEQRERMSDALWRGFSPAEKARFELNLWHWLQRALGRRPKTQEKRSVYELLLRRHEQEPHSHSPISDDELRKL